MKKNLFFLFFLLFMISNALPNVIEIKENKMLQSIETDTLQKKVLQQLELKETDINQELFVSKDLPYAKYLTVMVIPKFILKEDHFFEYDAYIVLVNKGTGEIVQKYYEPHAWVSDAMVLSGIEIDTGQYILSKTIKAFGVRVNYSGSSRAYPFEETEFSLYVPEDKSLRKVLSNFSLVQYQGEWDTNCIGTFNSTESIVIIDSKHQTHGFNNLVIKQKTITVENFLENGDCKEREVSKKKIKRALKFDGKVFKEDIRKSL